MKNAISAKLPRRLEVKHTNIDQSEDNGAVRCI